MKFSPTRLITGVVGLCVILELGTRAGGAVDFPLYHVDDGIGYIPEPNQSGRFLHAHSWAFNDRSMGTAATWNPEEHPNILLIGNSVVMGGNPYDQRQKLGPQLQQDIGSGYSVWSIAAGGWTTVNEMTYLKRNPDVAARQSLFIWEYMAGGLSGLNPWPGQYVFPREKPLCASCYLFRRYVWPHLFHPDRSELPPVGDVDKAYGTEFQSAVSALSRATGASPPRRPGVLFLYPTRQQFQDAKAGREWIPERAEIERIADSNGLLLLDIARAPEWKETLYRPDHVHPTAEGNAVLARLLAAASKTALTDHP